MNEHYDIKYKKIPSKVCKHEKTMQICKFLFSPYVVMDIHDTRI